MLSKFGSYFAFSANVEPDAATLHDALISLTKAVAELGSDISTWRGYALGAISIITKSNSVNSEIKACSITTRALHNWTDEEEDRSFNIANELCRELSLTVEAAITARPKFRKIVFLGDPVALAILRTLRASAGDLVGSLVSMARRARISDAEAMASKVDRDFSSAFAAFDAQGDDNESEVTAQGKGARAGVAAVS